VWAAQASEFFFFQIQSAKAENVFINICKKEYYKPSLQPPCHKTEIVVWLNDIDESPNVFDAGLSWNWAERVIRKRPARKVASSKKEQTDYRSWQGHWRWIKRIVTQRIVWFAIEIVRKLH